DHGRADQLTSQLAARRSIEQGSSEQAPIYFFPEIPGAVAALAKDRLTFSLGRDRAAARQQADSMAASPGKGIAGTSWWRGIAKHLPVDSNLIAYADADTLRAFAEHSLPQGQQENYSRIAPLLKPWRYVLAGSAIYANTPTEKYHPVAKTRSHTVLFLGVDK
ncbi:MAG TPA: hypothetical protein VM409_05210, partial [Chloroflexia bacterium]|nr:hypothetical protein [Chloroflexia bacterium]